MSTNATTLHAFDWIIIVCYMAGTIALGLYFTRRGGRDITSFFVSGRALPWYLGGISLVATSFASDTPLWVSSLVRQHGVYYIWQYWSPAIGIALGVVLFARLWRRLGIVTDIEMIEARYSGKTAAALRFWMGFSGALLFCPLIISWVTKAMETITREAMGLPEEYRVLTTIVVIGVALIACALSGLWGVVYTDFLQFMLSVVGTVTLAAVAVYEVGGLDVMVAKLSANTAEHVNILRIAPSIGSGPGQMAIWTAIGYFGILWLHNALVQNYNAQRLLACRDARHATHAMLLFSVLYYGFVCWPWIIVALCSVILLPDLGAGISHDAAYPRMIVSLLPVGLRGMLITAMLAAFMSTISTLFNWGSSYLVNDVYKRFIIRHAKPHHYVNVGRLATLVMAAVGGMISFMADDIQQLLTTAYVIMAAGPVVCFLRWFWWRINAKGELASSIITWILAPLMLFGKVFDEPARVLFGFEGNLSSDDHLLGARMMFMIVIVTSVAIVVSLLTPPTEPRRMREFVLQARPFRLLWKPVIEQLAIVYEPGERMGRTLMSWIVLVIAVYSLMVGMGKLLFGAYGQAAACLVVCIIAFWLTLRRIREDFNGPAEGKADIAEEDLFFPDQAAEKSIT